MLFTQGFASFKQLSGHFIKHGAKFKAATMQDYLMLADAFVGAPLSALPMGTMECIRNKAQIHRGDRVRYNCVTNEFGVMMATGHIRTYYRPDPAIHEELSNLDHFCMECQR